MAKVSLEDNGQVAVLRLTSGVINAIGPELVDELSLALQEVQGRFRGMVLAGGNKFFSIGLDLPALLKLGRKDMAAFWDTFEDTVLALYTLPIPTAAAIAGHATAGGAILALACDFRFAAAGRNLIGLNEISIGVPVPYLADRMLRQTVGDRVATEMEYRGKLVGSEEAKAIGLIDGIFPAEEVESRSIATITELTAMTAPAFSLTKQHRTREIPSRFNAIRPGLNRTFMDSWFVPATQALLEEAAQKF
jgi:enoyl-CoA hydratase/carnithine racemase